MTREGTEEDGVDEAGRSTEPPLMAPPRRESTPEADEEASATPTGIMAPPPKASTGKKADAAKADAGEPAGRDEVPFPADGIGQPADKPADDKGGHARTESADEHAAEDTAKADAAAGEQDAAVGKADGDRSAVSRGGNGASKLEGGLQTVKQAVAATNNWFASRVAKAEAVVTGTGEAGARRTEDAGRGETVSGEHADESARADVRPAGARGTTARPGLFGGSTPSAGSSSSAGPAGSAAPDPSAGSAAQAPAASDEAGDPPPKWNDPYPAYSTPPSQPPSAHTAPLAPGPLGPGPGPLGSGSLGSGRPGADPGTRPASRGWTARPPGRPGPGPSAKRQKASARRNRRQAHLTLSRVEPWSVMKFSFVVSVVAFIILFVAIAILYGVLSSIGVFESLQRVVNSVTSSQNSSGTNVTKWFSASRVLGYTGLLGSLNIVLITAMSTIGAVIYNLISRVFGGIEITLRETE